MVKIRRGRLVPYVILGYILLLSNLGQAEKGGEFTGAWVANGTREVMKFGPDREAALFKLSGHVNLKGEVGGITDYWSQCIGLADSMTGSQVRCTWRSSGGTLLYLTLTAERMGQDAIVRGSIIGGTGGAEGITGSLEFKWSSMSFQSENETVYVGGYAKELKGTYQLP